MIPYMVGKLAPNSSRLTKGLVKYVPGTGNFRAVPSQNGDKYVTSPPPPIVELVDNPSHVVRPSLRPTLQNTNPVFSRKHSLKGHKKKY